MATPPEGFGAHDRTPTCLSNFEQLRNAAAKVFSLHVIGVSTKRFIAPREVLRIRARPTPATELRHMNVINFGFRQRTLQPILVELRVTPRPGKAAHICERLNTKRF